MGLFDDMKKDDDRHQEVTNQLELLLSARDADRREIVNLTNAVDALNEHVRTVDEEQPSRLDRLSISPLSDTTSPPSESVESRLNEIEKTLVEISKNVDGSNVNDALNTLVKNVVATRKVLNSVAEKLAAQAADSTKAARELTASAKRVEAVARREIDRAVKEISGQASDVVLRELDSANRRADALQEANLRAGRLRLWESAAAFVVGLIPLAMILASVWMAVAALTWGWGWAFDVGNDVWLGIGRGLAAVAGTGAALGALFLTARWLYRLASAWRFDAKPTWPRWRDRQ